MRFASVKKLYGIRSKAVHGDSLSEKQLTEGTAQSFELLRSLLLLCIDQERDPTEDDINRAVFE